jgi:hypothetical protein
LEFKSQQRKEIFLISKMSKQVPGPTQPPIQWVLGFSTKAKCQGVMLKHSPPRSAKVKNDWNYISTAPTCPHGMDRETFNFTFEITIHPNWSTIRLSRGDGTRQNLCKKN